MWLNFGWAKMNYFRTLVYDSRVAAHTYGSPQKAVQCDIQQDLIQTSFFVVSTRANVHV